MPDAQTSAITAFRELHVDGCFVLPNPWDIGTAIYLQHLGFKALATTSAGYAFSRGHRDGGVSRDEMLVHIREVVAATALPVNADFLNGFADEPENVGENVKRCIATGVAGLSIEDSTGRENEPLYKHDAAVARIKAARAAIDSAGIPIVLTGRCEAFLVDYPDPLRTVLARLVAYAEAGAECLYAPGLTTPDEIDAVVRAVAPKPVNVLVSGFNAHLSLTQLADLGVRRISVGSGLALSAWGAFSRAAQDLVRGDFAALARAASFSELNQLFRP
ncbi:MAG: isocitrate lyase/phosphoenolpyruvate mutase family protein [Verrucomicrobiota bacterium]|nr:isocitrate lyase/phosphoenolpyruvate mutase family protein [Verrucomicrobiota bacterium]